MGEEEKEKNEKKGQQQGPGLVAHLVGSFSSIMFKQELHQIMNGCREMAELFAREAKEAKIELNKEIIEKAYKLRLRCYHLTEKMVYNANVFDEKYDQKEIEKEVYGILEERKEFWEFCEKETEKLKKEIEVDRVAEKAVQKIIQMAKEGKDSSKRFDNFDIKNGIPIFQ